MSSIKTSTVDQDIVEVGTSWIQDNADNYVFTKLPIVRGEALVDGYSGVLNWELPKLENFLLAGELVDWKAGEALPTDIAIESTPVSATYESKAARTRSRALRSKKPRFKDVNNYTRGILAELYQGCEKRLFSDLQTFFSSTESFTGGAGDPLADGEVAAHQPHLDIEKALRGLRLYASDRFKVECIMTDDVLDILRTFSHYHGAGIGSNSASLLGKDEFQRIFADKHRLDAVHVNTVALNSAKLGQTASIDRPQAGGTGGGGLLLFILVDRAAGEFDARDQMLRGDEAPDGGLVMVRGDDFLIDTREPGDRTEKFLGTIDFGFKSPRGATWGKRFNPAHIVG